jgi:hypothetical protein
LILISASNSFAKSKIICGYVITFSGDTINGYIEYNKWNETPREILFKKSENEFGKLYTPKTISEFYVNGKIYTSAIVKIDQNQYKTNELSSLPDFQFTIDTVFLEAVILGDKELYYLKDSTRKINFYIKNDSIYEWLIHRRFFKTENNKVIVAENNNYIGQLLIYFNDYDSFNSVLSTTTYELKSLTKVFNYYYECTNSKVKYREKEDKHKIFFWLN